MVENTGLKLEGLDEKAVVYQRVFSLQRRTIARFSVHLRNYSNSVFTRKNLNNIFTGS